MSIQYLGTDIYFGEHSPCSASPIFVEILTPSSAKTQPHGCIRRPLNGQYVHYLPGHQRR